jgi:hypothetical protein
MFWTALVKLITAILSVMSGWFAGRASAVKESKIEELQSYADTSKKIAENVVLGKDFVLGSSQKAGQ